jgi:hypothetical protein
MMATDRIVIPKMFIDSMNINSRSVLARHYIKITSYSNSMKQLQNISEISNNKIFQTVAEGLQGTNVELLAPGLDGYEENIKKYSEAAEKRAVSFNIE